MYEAFTLNPFAASMTCITPDTSKSIPSLTGLNVTVCPSIFSGGIGSLTAGGLYPIHEKIEDETALGSSKAIIFSKSQVRIPHFLIPNRHGETCESHTFLLGVLLASC